MLAIIGVILMFHYSKTPDTLLDWVWIAVGATLVATYCVISWGQLKGLFGKDASIVLPTPPLLTFGILAVHCALTASWFVPPHDKVMLGIGAAFIVISLVLLFKALKR